MSPRFQGENFGKNLKLVDQIESLAKNKGCTSSQLSLAWVLAQGENIFPIPGTKRLKYLEENAGALNVKLSTAELEMIDQMSPKGIASGLLYPKASMKFVDA